MDVDFHTRVRAEFHDIAAHEPDRCILIDASQPPPVVLARALEIVRALP